MNFRFPFPHISSLRDIDVERCSLSAPKLGQVLLFLRCIQHKHTVSNPTNYSPYQNHGLQCCSHVIPIWHMVFNQELCTKNTNKKGIYSILELKELNNDKILALILLTYMPHRDHNNPK